MVVAVRSLALDLELFLQVMTLHTHFDLFVACAFNTPFATRCSKKAKSWRNAHKTGAAGATAQLGLPGLLRGRK